MMSSEINDKEFSLSNLTTYQVGAMEAAAHRALRTHKDGCLQKHGLSGMQWYIIGSVLDTGDQGSRITDLAKQLDTTLAFLTNTVNLLESKDMLVRSANGSDSRSRIIKVSPKFVPVCHQIEAELRKELRSSIYSKVTPEELRTYIKVMAKFTEL